MQPGSHIHIISAGESIHTAYPAVLRKLPGVTRTYVIADSESYGISQNPQIEKQRAATRNAVETVKEISASLSIPLSRETIFEPFLPSIRTSLVRIRRDNPGARFTFDLSGGPKRLCMALFSLAPWLDGEVFCSFDGKAPQSLPFPGREVQGIFANVNYQTILAVLLRNRKAKNGNSPDEWVSRQYLFQQVWPYYIRLRTRTPKPGDPVVRYRHGRKPANDLSHQTFSTFMATLRVAGLVEDGQDPKNRKEKAYRINDIGETSFRFFADPAANSIVNMMLEHP